MLAAISTVRRYSCALRAAHAPRPVPVGASGRPGGRTPPRAPSPAARGPANGRGAVVDPAHTTAPNYGGDRRPCKSRSTDSAPHRTPNDWKESRMAMDLAILTFDHTDGAERALGKVRDAAAGAAWLEEFALVERRHNGRIVIRGTFAGHYLDVDQAATRWGATRGSALSPAPSLAPLSDGSASRQA